jgi:hypothetical protein
LSPLGFSEFKSFIWFIEPHESYYFPNKKP